jgi:L-alanine-DL-glutamate epimerase-like enolase superfamily enzyme
MKITRVRTIQAPEQPHILWLQVHTDEGIVGLGETYHNAHAIRAMLVQEFAPRYLIGKDPLAIEETWRSINEWTNFAGWAGADQRALSAIDIALWDILGQATGRPVWQLLGGRVAPRIPVYNTCGTWGDLDFMKNPDEFARRLLALGIRGMKIWPFDEWGRKTNGGYLHPRDLEQAIRPVEMIRDAVGRDIDLAMEFHSFWSLNAAVQIAHALEPYGVMWLEDMMKTNSPEAFETLARSTRLPVALSERLLARHQFLPYLQRGAVRVVIFDTEWCGGITEARKIASLADTFQVPVALHNYGGPVLNFASAHVAATIPNLMVQEVGMNLLDHYRTGWVTNPPRVEGGAFVLPETPGIGTALAPELLARRDLIVGEA